MVSGTVCPGMRSTLTWLIQGLWMNGSALWHLAQLMSATHVTSFQNPFPSVFQFVLPSGFQGDRMVGAYTRPSVW